MTEVIETEWYGDGPIIYHMQVKPSKSVLPNPHVLGAVSNGRHTDFTDMLHNAPVMTARDNTG